MRNLRSRWTQLLSSESSSRLAEHGEHLLSSQLSGHDRAMLTFVTHADPSRMRKLVEERVTKAQEEGTNLLPDFDRHRQEAEKLSERLGTLNSQATTLGTSVQSRVKARATSTNPGQPAESGSYKNLDTDRKLDRRPAALARTLARTPELAASTGSSPAQAQLTDVKQNRVSLRWEGKSVPAEAHAAPGVPAGSGQGAAVERALASQAASLSVQPKQTRPTTSSDRRNERIAPVQAAESRLLPGQAEDRGSSRSGGNFNGEGRAYPSATSASGAEGRPTNVGRSYPSTIRSATLAPPAAVRAEPVTPLPSERRGPAAVSKVPGQLGAAPPPPPNSRAGAVRQQSVAEKATGIPARPDVSPRPVVAPNTLVAPPGLITGTDLRTATPRRETAPPPPVVDPRPTAVLLAKEGQAAVEPVAPRAPAASVRAGAAIPPAKAAPPVASALAAAAPLNRTLATPTPPAASEISRPGAAPARAHVPHPPAASPSPPRAELAAPAASPQLSATASSARQVAAESVAKVKPAAVVPASSGVQSTEVIRARTAASKLPDSAAAVSKAQTVAPAEPKVVRSPLGTPSAAGHATNPSESTSTRQPAARGTPATRPEGSERHASAAATAKPSATGVNESQRTASDFVPEAGAAKSPLPRRSQAPPISPPAAAAAVSSVPTFSPAAGDRKAAAPELPHPERRGPQPSLRAGATIPPATRAEPVSPRSAAATPSAEPKTPATEWAVKKQAAAPPPDRDPASKTGDAGLSKSSRAEAVAVPVENRRPGLAERVRAALNPPAESASQAPQASPPEQVVVQPPTAAGAAAAELRSEVTRPLPRALPVSSALRKAPPPPREKPRPAELLRSDRRGERLSTQMLNVSSRLPGPAEPPAPPPPLEINAPEVRPKSGRRGDPVEALRSVTTPGSSDDAPTKRRTRRSRAEKGAEAAAVFSPRINFDRARQSLSLRAQTVGSVAESPLLSAWHRPQETASEIDAPAARRVASALPVVLEPADVSTGDFRVTAPTEVESVRRDYPVWVRPTPAEPRPEANRASFPEWIQTRLGDEAGAPAYLPSAPHRPPAPLAVAEPSGRATVRLEALPVAGDGVPLPGLLLPMQAGIMQTAVSQGWVPSTKTAVDATRSPEPQLELADKEVEGVRGPASAARQGTALRMQTQAPLTGSRELSGALSGAVGKHETQSQGLASGWKDAPPPPSAGQPPARPVTSQVPIYAPVLDEQARRHRGDAPERESSSRRTAEEAVRTVPGSRAEPRSVPAGQPGRSGPVDDAPQRERGQGGHSGQGGRDQDRRSPSQPAAEQKLIDSSRRTQLDQTVDLRKVEAYRLARSEESLQMGLRTRMAPQGQVLNDLAQRTVGQNMHTMLKKAYRLDSLHDLSRDEAVNALGLVLKLGGEFTFAHSARVLDFAMDLADECGIHDEETREQVRLGSLLKDTGEMAILLDNAPPEKLDQMAEYFSRQDMRQAGLLHDLGKIKIPDEILYKPGKLTAEEYEIMKLHPVYGEEMLFPIDSLRHLCPAVRGHHERWDGKGYPDGLEGENIPLAARIIAVADVYDALAAERPYKAGMPVAKVQAILREGKGTHFDPDLVDAFDRVLQRRFPELSNPFDD